MDPKHCCSTLCGAPHLLLNSILNWSNFSEIWWFENFTIFLPPYNSLWCSLPIFFSNIEGIFLRSVMNTWLVPESLVSRVTFSRNSKEPPKKPPRSPKSMSAQLITKTLLWQFRYHAFPAYFFAVPSLSYLFPLQIIYVIALGQTSKVKAKCEG